MKNTSVLLLVVGLIFLFFCVTRVESFSDSGIAVSDDYLERLVKVYQYPRCDGGNKEMCRQQNMDKIHGYGRRLSVNDNTGNYYTIGGMLH